MRSLILLVLLTLATPGLAAAAPPAGGTSPAVDGLTLTVRLDGAGRFEPGAPILATVTLTNVGTSPRTVWSHVKTHEVHHDWLALDVSWPVPTHGRCGRRAHGEQRTVVLLDARDKSIPIERVLAPGEQLTHVIDLAAWLPRAHLLGDVWGPGSYQVRVRYHVRPEPGRWSGTLEAPPIGFEVRGRPAAGRCPANPGWSRFAPTSARARN